MRLLSFQAADGLHIGAITDAGVVDFSLLDADAPTDLGEAIKGGQLNDLATLLAKAGEQVDRQAGSFRRGHRAFKCLFQVQCATEPGGMRRNGGHVGQKALCGDV